MRLSWWSLFEHSNRNLSSNTATNPISFPMILHCCKRSAHTDTEIAAILPKTHTLEPIEKDENDDDGQTPGWNFFSVFACGLREINLRLAHSFALSLSPRRRSSSIAGLPNEWPQFDFFLFQQIKKWNKIARCLLMNLASRIFPLFIISFISRSQADLFWLALKTAFKLLVFSFVTAKQWG